MFPSIPMPGVCRRFYHPLSVPIREIRGSSFSLRPLCNSAPLRQIISP
jgi:hypothetical protein